MATEVMEELRKKTSSNRGYPQPLTQAGGSWSHRGGARAAREAASGEGGKEKPFTLTLPPSATNTELMREPASLAPEMQS